MLAVGFFIETFDTNPLFFISVVVTVIVSITLHELAHGWAALWQGDDTPRVTGHMTWNPIVHMGWFSIILLLMAGIAFGAMPVNPRRFRSRYGDALVAAAGPAMNLVLWFVAVLTLGLWHRYEDAASPYTTEQALTLASNTQLFLVYFALTNGALVLLNLIPIPPLDGSRILANFNRGYAQLIYGVQNPHAFLFALIALLTVLSYTDFGLFDLSSRATVALLRSINGRVPIEQ